LTCSFIFVGSSAFHGFRRRCRDDALSCSTFLSCLEIARTPRSPHTPTPICALNTKYRVQQMPSTIIGRAVIHSAYPNIQSVPIRKADIRMIMIIDNLRVPLNLPIIVIELKITLTGETFCPEVDRIIPSSGSSVLPINKVDILNIIRGEQLLVIG